MRQSLYLHIGAHKTGTTSLQYALGKNADRLRQTGFLFPSAARVRYAHRRLAFGLRDKQDHDIGDIPDPQQEIQALLSEIEDSNVSTVILSCEGLFALDENAIRFLFDSFRAFDTKVIAYIRRQDNLLLSAYNQRIKKRRTEYNKSFHELLSDPKKHLTDYRRNLDRWASVFGRHNLTVRCYELAGDIVTDFQRLAGIPFVLLDPQLARRRNTSVSVDGIRIMRWLKPLIRSEANRKRLVKLLKELPLRDDVSSIMTDSDRKRILQIFEKDNAYVFRTYLDSENLYDPELLLAREGDEQPEGRLVGPQPPRWRRFWPAGVWAEK